MSMTSPALSRNPMFKDRAKLTPRDEQILHDMASPNAVPEAPMTIEGTIVRSVLSFVVLLIGGAAGWLLVGNLLTNPGMVNVVFTVSGIVAFVLALVNIFKREPVPALILLYAVSEGVLIGGLSRMYNTMWDGIVIQAVAGTALVIAVTLALFASGKIRASRRATKVFMIGMFSYIGLMLVNFLLIWLVPGMNPWGIGGISVFGIPLGVIIGILVVLMGAYSLVLNFDYVQRGVANQAPAKYAWSGVFSIMLTVVWLYLQILQILGIARSS